MKILKKKNIFWAIGAVIVIMVIVGISRGAGKEEVVQAVRTNIVQEIVVTGKTKAVNEVDLGFDKTGRVARSYVGLGDKVYKGQVIAELDISNELAEIAQERATLAEEEAKRVGEGESLESAIFEAFAAADNAVHNKTDQFFIDPFGNPRFEVKFTDGNYVHYFDVPAELAIKLNAGRKNMETLLLNWKNELAQLTPSTARQSGDISLNRLVEVSLFLNDVAYAVNSFKAADFAYETTVDKYKSAVDSARGDIAAARSALVKAKEISSQTNGNASQSEARIDRIRSSIMGIQSSIAKSRIVAPFAGTVTKQDAKVGSIAVAGSPLVSLISDSQMYLEANISEVNIGKVALNNPVVIEFDAFPGEVFKGKISYIEPGETLVDGVVNYKSRIDLDAKDARIKSGLTATLTIETAKKDNVVALPSYTLIADEKEAKKKFVNIRNGNDIRKTQVSTGLVGSNGFVEIVEGIKEGETVVFGE